MYPFFEYSELIYCFAFSQNSLLRVTENWSHVFNVYLQVYYGWHSWGLSKWFKNVWLWDPGFQVHRRLQWGITESHSNAKLNAVWAGTFNCNALKFCWQVFITCSVILCAEGSSNSRCAQGCLQEHARKRRRDVSKETARHYITQGPFRLSRQTQHSAAGMLVTSKKI